MQICIRSVVATLGTLMSTKQGCCSCLAWHLLHRHKDSPMLCHVQTTLLFRSHCTCHHTHLCKAESCRGSPRTLCCALSPFPSLRSQTRHDIHGCRHVWQPTRQGLRLAPLFLHWFPTPVLCLGKRLWHRHDCISMYSRLAETACVMYADDVPVSALVPCLCGLE